MQRISGKSRDSNAFQISANYISKSNFGVKLIVSTVCLPNFLSPWCCDVQLLTRCLQTIILACSQTSSPVTFFNYSSVYWSVARFRHGFQYLRLVCGLYCVFFSLSFWPTLQGFIFRVLRKSRILWSNWAEQATGYLTLISWPNLMTSRPLPAKKKET